ncbi:hypothetical protein wVul_1176 [Wolbachia endosymbiont of Armadillidium vulgare str. wVulC]|nr:hypothetical protein wVul_1176 [Wolbachia endosymbiont of Armadillidium vulgare str. wVulC]
MLKSGEYGGRYKISAPTPLANLIRLMKSSIIKVCPGSKIGVAMLHSTDRHVNHNEFTQLI